MKDKKDFVLGKVVIGTAGDLYEYKGFPFDIPRWHISEEES